MAIEFKDYYETLGVPKAASEAEIRKAFRRLARLYHPDIAGDNTSAETKFKEINEAYEVLGDPDKRRHYDEVAASSSSGSPRETSGTWNYDFGNGNSGQFVFRGTGFSDFFEEMFGRRAERQNRPRSQRHAHRFHPDGQEESERPDKGEDLEADLLVTLDEVSRGAVRPITVKRAALCDTCFGVGNFNGQKCSFCNGTGQAERSCVSKVRIPRGIREGQLLRLAGQGEPSENGGPAGDLYLKVRYARHPDFQVRQNTLHHDLELAPWEAVLGTNVSVPTLSGRVSIRIPPGTQAGHKLRVRAQGLPDAEGTKGDLVVTVHIQVPVATTAREKALWTELARESHFPPREG